MIKFEIQSIIVLLVDNVSPYLNLLLVAEYFHFRGNTLFENVSFVGYLPFVVHIPTLHKFVKRSVKANHDLLTTKQKKAQIRQVIRVYCSFLLNLFSAREYLE